MNATRLDLYGLHIHFSFIDLSDPPTTCNVSGLNGTVKSVCLLALSCSPPPPSRYLGLNWSRGTYPGTPVQKRP